MGPDMVVVNHEAPSIAPVLVEGGCDRGGFIELLAPGALASLDATILFGTAWLGDLHGNATLLEKFLEDAAELGAVVGLDPWMTTGKVSRMRSKAARMLRAKGVVTFRGDQFRDRVADRQLIDSATGGIAQKQGVGLYPLSGLVGATAFLSADCVGTCRGSAGGPEAKNACFS